MAAILCYGQQPGATATKFETMFTFGITVLSCFVTGAYPDLVASPRKTRGCRFCDGLRAPGSGKTGPLIANGRGR
jgi:hypothetical protein